MASGVTVPNNFMSCDGIGRNSIKQFEDFYFLSEFSFSSGTARNSHGGCSIKKAVLKNIHRKTPVVESLF